jgi:hypothetical protein
MRQLTIFGVPQHNTLVENKNGTLLEIVSLMMTQANLPIKYCNIHS